MDVFGIGRGGGVNIFFGAETEEGIAGFIDPGESGGVQAEGDIIFVIIVTGAPGAAAGGSDPGIEIVNGEGGALIALRDPDGEIGGAIIGFTAEFEVGGGDGAIIGQSGGIEIHE